MTMLEIANVIRDFSLDAENMFGEIDLVKELRKFADRIEDEIEPPAPAKADLHLHKHGEER